jgi:hypothetical protein
VFAEQAELLAGRGVDLFAVETFFDLDELVTAIDAVRSVSSLPIVAMMTFGDDAETIGGVPAAEAAGRLAALGVAAIGTNHGAGPNAALAALQAMGDSMPLAAMPNIGLASMSGGRIIYPHAAPEYFAEFAAHARDLGAKLIGGTLRTEITRDEALELALDDLEGKRRCVALRRRSTATRATVPAGATAARRRDSTICGLVPITISSRRAGRGSGLGRLPPLFTGSLAKVGVDRARGGRSAKRRQCRAESIAGN